MNAQRIALVAAVVLIASCGGTSDDVGSDEPLDTVPGFDSESVMGEWVLTEAELDGDRLDLGDVRVTMRLATGEVGGVGGCNGYGGTIDIAGDGSVSVDELASTLMSCGDPADAIERAFLTALGQASELMLEDDGQVLVLVSVDSIWTFGRDADGDGEPDVDVDPLDGSWDVADLTTRGERIELTERVTVEIEGDEIRGTAACNGYSGRLDSDRGRTFGTFVVSELGWTEMGCEPDVMAIEQAFLQALQDVDSYEVADGLYLSAPEVGSSMHLVRLSPTPDVAFAGTLWSLDTVIEGEAASNWTAMGDVVVEFRDDGTLFGATGCSGIAGTWTLDGSSLTIGDLSRDDIPALSDCDDAARELDAIVFGVLEGLDLRVHLDGRRLTITARTADGETGLSFRATDDPTDDSNAELDDLDTEGLDTGGGVDGPVMYAARVDAGGEVSAAEIRGELELDGGCLYVVLESVRYPVLWPFGTRWDPATESVVLPGGRSVPVGGDPAGGGGYPYADQLAGFTSSDDVRERIDRCAEGPYFEIAVLQTW